MQTFKIKATAFKEIKKKMIIRLSLFALVITAIVCIIEIVNEKADIISLLIYIPIMVLAVGFGIYRGINRQRILLESYELVITNNMVIREQLNTPDIGVYFNDIKKITKLKNKFIIINGKDASDVIFIPPQIDNRTQLEEALQDIHPITIQDKVSLLRKFQIALGFVSAGLMVCVYAVNNKIIVAIAGTAFVALMVWSSIKLLKSKNIDNRTKKRSWVVLIVLGSVIYIMILKLTGAGIWR